VLEIAREIQFRGYTSPEAVSLTPSEGTVMRYLFPHPGALSSQVASATGLRSSNLTAVLRGLEQKGLIERVADPEDARVFDGTIRHHLELADPPPPKPNTGRRSSPPRSTRPSRPSPPGWIPRRPRRRGPLTWPTPPPQRRAGPAPAPGRAAARRAHRRPRHLHRRSTARRRASLRPKRRARDRRARPPIASAALDAHSQAADRTPMAPAGTSEHRTTAVRDRDVP
jgi:hypothetical protein